MRFRCDLRLIVGLCVSLWILSGSPVSADDESAQGSGVFERIGNTAKKVEEKHIGEKVERKLKKAADKTAEGFKKAGDKIDQKLNH